MQGEEYIQIPRFTRFIKRSFDVITSSLALIILSPFLLVLAALIRTDSEGPAFYTQKRVGRYGKIFRMYKFRSMKADKNRHVDEEGNEQEQLYITVKNDVRITRLGSFIRHYKIDELPQLFNVFLGQMSIVGPRPEVPEYVALYTDEQRNILSVRPGLTDPASIHFIDEEQILAASDTPEKTYVEEIMSRKIQLGIEYIKGISPFSDITLIFKTIFSIIKK